MSFARPRQPQRRAGVPLAPMLDVLFLLLIFFATSTTFRAGEQQIDVDLPVAKTGQTVEPLRTEVVVNIKEDGSIVVSGRALELGELRSMLVKLVERFPEERVIIRADASARHGRVVEVMDAAELAQVGEVRLATQRRRQNEGG
ncbi:MAG: biopolymer transporter ExbD [Alphaproteobacteria bacterium]|jgi:biopolymer transport protein ExbD|nr:biopolymer transporter ExbD [Alphaproteobacteria bacterium]